MDRTAHDSSLADRHKGQPAITGRIGAVGIWAKFVASAVQRTIGADELRVAFELDAQHFDLFALVRRAPAELLRVGHALGRAIFTDTPPKKSAAADQ